MIIRFFNSALILLLLLATQPLFADTNQDFQTMMKIWNQKASLASQYLDNAEELLKEGDALEACSSQKKAGDYGIEATEALIKAFQINGNTEQEISNLNTGLNKWKELRDFC